MSIVFSFLSFIPKQNIQEREELDVEILTFEKFLRLLNKISPRTDVQELFVKL